MLTMFFGACSNEEILQDTNSGTNTGDGRTITLTASMPDEPTTSTPKEITASTTKGPTTRVALEQKTDKTIALTWEAGDDLQLVFVQETTNVKVVSTVTITEQDITNDGKKAKFDLELPASSTGFNDKISFDLYGVYGGGKLTGTIVTLPSNAGNATSLDGTEDTSVQNRKDVMLSFASTKIDATNPNVSVVFNHLGSLFSITLKNTGEASLDNLQEALLVGVTDGNVNWAYNATGEAQSYDLATGKFQNIESAGNQISFKSSINSLPAGGETTFWGWYPPLPDKNWPALQLQLKNTTATLATSTNNKPARVNPTAAGKSFSFYAEVNGANLVFTAPPLGADEYYIGEMGTLGTVLGDSKSTITRMILKGQINAADFAVMKKYMPKLTYLDLSQVICKDNKIPSNAFGDNDYYSRNKTITTIILPESITSIGYQAFRACSGLTGNLTIPDNVTSIGGYAFYDCKNLTGSLTIPDNVTSIGDYAFYGCSGFTGSLTIGDKVESIGEGAFSSCKSFTGSLTIPDNVTSIGEGAFSSCKSFTGSLTIPNNVTSIGNYTFDGCTGFTGSLTIPDKVNSIGASAFRSCSGFTGSLTIGDKVESIGERAFQDCEGFTGSLTIPANVTSIGGYAFSICKSFTGSLTIGDKVESIGENAFLNCSGFTGSLTIPNNVTSIGNNAFAYCTGFTGSLTIGDKVESIGEKAFQNCSGFTGSLTIPADVTSIGRYAFYACKGFTGSLTIGDNVTSIGFSAFDGCTGFTGSLTIPANVTSIGSSAFLNCQGFASLTIGDKVESIGPQAFQYCKGFTGSLTIPDKVTSIGNNAFAYCPNVTAFQFLNATPITYESNMLASGKPVIVPTEEAITAYQTKWGSSGNHSITAASE